MSDLCWVTEVKRCSTRRARGLPFAVTKDCAPGTEQCRQTPGQNRLRQCLKAGTVTVKDITSEDIDKFGTESSEGQYPHPRQREQHPAIQ